jgi:hypothetical protein
MSAAGPAAATPGAIAGEPPLEWRVNPWRERPVPVALAVTTVIVVSLGIARLDLPWLPRLVLVSAFAGFLAPLYLPERCRIDERGAGHRILVWERREWSALKRAGVRYEPGGPWVSLSTVDRPGLLATFRSMTLRLPRRRAERDALVAEILKRLARHGL